MRESDQRLYIHFNFSLLLLGIMRKKCTTQTESRIIDEKIYFNTATFKLLGDCLRAAGISQINAENSALNLEFCIKTRGQRVQFACGAGYQYQVHPTRGKCLRKCGPKHL